MAVLSPPRAATPDLGAVARSRGLGTVAEHAVVLAAAAWALSPLAHATGGRGAHLLSIAVVLAALAVAVTRPWQRGVARSVYVGALAPGLAAGVVCLVSGSTFGASWAAAYLLAGLLGLAVIGYVAGGPHSARLRVVVAIVVLAGLDQVGKGFIAWWGGGTGTSAHPMLGTFYWHDPFAAFLLAPAVLGLAFAVEGRAGFRAAGIAVAAVSSAGIVLSTSRATLGCLAVGWLAVVVLGLRAAGVRRTTVGAVFSAACTAGLLVLLTGPPVFASRAPIFGATATRGSGESLSRNGGYRLEFWREAWHSFAHHIPSGGGFGSLAGNSTWVPHGWAISPLAHNGYLQALADGGLLLGIPVLVVTGAVLWRSRRPLVTALRDRRDVVPAAAAVALGLLLAHSAVDVDWSYPALLAVAGLLAGVVVASGRGSATGSDVAPAPHGRTVAAALIVAGAVLALATAAWSGGLQINSNHEQSAPATGSYGGDTP
jgi:hypothetical protein